ncbi:MAG: cytochrome c [Bacteroidota bacterium]|nr:cytochrome c [Bacteroidota bacterium]
MKKKSLVFGWLLGMLVTGSAFVQTFDLEKSIAQGKEAYITQCQNCHMEDGKGMAGVFPPLEKADFLKRPLREVIRVILKGQSGDVTVNGVKYTGIMPAQDYLTDEQIADILNYVFNNWGNKIANPVLPSMVAKARD